MQTLIYLENELSWNKAILESSDNIDDDYKYKALISELEGLIEDFKVSNPMLNKMKLVA